MLKKQNIEVLRIISAFGIVWYHCGAPGKEYAYAGLIAFFILSMYLAAQSNNPAARTVRMRARRLLLPWAAWFLVYGAINLLFGKEFFLTNGGLLLGILAGSVIHLWFMPFIFFCLVLFDQARLYLSPRSLAWSGALAAFGILAATPLWREASFNLYQPLPQYIHALAGACIGVFFAYKGAMDKYAGPMLVLLLATCAALLGYPGIGITYGLGMLVSYALLFWGDNMAWPDVRWLSNCTFGIYFIHMLLILALHKWLGLSILVLPIAVFVLAFVLVYGLRRLFPRWAGYWS